jgi:hypothetical protein
MKSSRDCQIIIGNHNSDFGAWCLFDTKYDKSSLPGYSATQLMESHTCRVRLSKMAQSATNLVDMDPVQHTAEL